VSANTHKEFALEILMTMAPILDEGVQSLSFRLEGIQQVVPYEYIRELLGFQKGAPEKVDVPDGFWNLISGEAHRQHNYIRNPIIQVFHSWMCKRIMGRMRETKVTDMELNWLYSALIAKQPIDPSYLMINRWCCEATSGSGDIGSGCYLSMLVISLRPGITRNPEYLLPGTPLGFEYLKQGKYISGDERGGFHVAKVNLPLPDPRLRLFIQGKIGWRRDSLSQRRKIKKRKNCIGGILLRTRGWCTTKLCATIRRNPYSAKLLRRSTNASMGEWCTGAPTKLCGAQRDLCGALHTTPPTTTKHGHNWRVCCKKHAKHRSHPIQCGSTW
jgi:hypothetical protein